MALLVEVVSIIAADKRIRKPIELPRPNDPAAKPVSGGPRTDAERDAAFKRGVSVLAATSKGVR